MKDLVFSLLFTVMAISALPAQKVSVHGSFGASTEFYQFNSTDSTLRPRRPDFNYRVFISPVLSVGKNFELPFTFELTKRLDQAFLPLQNFDNPIRNLTNPNNAVGLHPTFGWATFHLGSHTAQFSDLSTGNLPIFGAGFDIQPGRFRLAYSYGVSQWAIRPDTTLQLDGTYERHFQAAKIGVGKKTGSGIYLNAAKIRDVIGSQDGELPEITAQEGILTTLDFRLRFSKHFALSGEAGGSAFTNDLLAEGEGEGDLSQIPSYILNVRRSTHTDVAGKSAFEIDYKHWGIAFQAKYLGAGFESLGFGFVETDVFDLTIAPRLQLFKNRFILNGSIGQREDNLAKTKLITTRRLIGSGNMTAILTKKLSLSANYSNYGSRNSLDNDTLRIEFVSQNFSVTPVFRFKIGSSSNTVSATYAESKFDDKNLFSGALNTNDMTAVTGNWTLVFGKMTLSALGSISKNKRSTGQLDIHTWSLQPGISLLKRKLQASFGVVFGRIEQTGYTADNRLLLRPQLRWKANGRLQLRIEGSWQAYRYGSVRNDARYDESFLRTGFVQNF